MTFQAYLDSIKAKTGLDPADFRERAEARGLLTPTVPTGKIVAWLMDEFGLGRGHAMAIVTTLRPIRAGGGDQAEVIDKQFSGAKAHWRSTYDALIVTLGNFGPVATAATSTYISLLKGKGKFAVVAVTGDRLDIGIKIKGAAETERFEAAGTWNSMVTHRVRITAPEQIDGDVLDWLRRAYEAA